MNTEDPGRGRALGVGIVGLHHLHPMDYLPHFQGISMAEVRVIAEEDEQLRAMACAAAGAAGCKTGAELLERDDVDVVLVFLPHADCPAFVEQAARAGKHVIVEKPMAATAAGIQRMISAARAAGVYLSAPYCWRYHPVSRQIKEMVDAGVLGDIIALEGRCAAGSPERYLRGGISPWILDKARAGGGPMHNLGVHWIDLFRWLLEDEVESAAGMISYAQHGLEVEDNSFALLRFRGGATATLDISYSVPDAYPAGRDLFIALRGTRGALSWSPAWGGNADRLFFCSGLPEAADGPVRTLEIESRPVPGYGGVSGLAYLRETLEALAAGRPPAVSGRDGLRALQVVEAVYAAAETGCTTPVEEPAEGDLES